MRAWNKRSKEVAYLLNPAFCGRILYNTIKTYNKASNKIDNEVSKRVFPFPLIYLVLPLVLHKRTRNLISSKTKFLVWLQKYPEQIIDFPERAKDLIPITNEAIELLLQSGLIRLTNNAEIEIVDTVGLLGKNKYVDEEVKECLNKSEHIARWFFGAGKVETIYIGLGVRP